MIDELNSLHDKILHSPFAKEVTESEIQALVMAKEVLEQPKADWIPCEVALPEESLNSVIGWDEYRERCCFVQYYGGRWILGNGDESVKIVAWRNLPQPYKKEGAENDE